MFLSSSIIRSWYFNKGTEISIEWEFFDKKKNNKEDINVYMVQSERGFDAFERWTESYGIIFDLSLFLPIHFVVHFLFAYFLFSNHELLKETFQVDSYGDHK